MNRKELIGIVIMSLLTTWLMEYFLFNRKPVSTEVKSGQSFVAPERPLNVEVDFMDERRAQHPVKTEIETAHANMLFSSLGASLERLEFKREHNGKDDILTTVFPVNATEREKRCFLVALNQNTPYFYDLVSHKDFSDTVELVYSADATDARITKTFVVHKATDKIDLTVRVEPKADKAVELRIWYPTPILSALLTTDIKAGVTTDERGSVVKVLRSKIEPNKWWFKPAVFGTEDRYFVFAMIADTAQFVQRAYYRLAGHNELYAALEGPTVTQDRSWTLSFYMGPKEASRMAAVDPRLESTLEYAGWRAPISKVLLLMLIALYKWLGNYGLAIIVLTIGIRLVLLPFSLRGEKTMKERAEYQKKLQYVQQRYSQDPERLAQERKELMEKHGVSGVSGCLPLLVQIPIFFALSSVLSSAIQLYQAPFLWIPDLSASDPYYVLPCLIFFAMLWQAMIADEKSRTSTLIMALIFGAFSTSFAAGLSLYIFLSTVLAVLQATIYKMVKAA